MKKRRWRRVLTILLGSISLAVGITKVLGASVWVETFFRFQFPAWWFFHAVGVAEMVGGTLLLFGRRERFAAVLLAAVWAGAGITHLRGSEFGAALLPLILLVLLILVVYGVRPNGTNPSPE